VVLLLANPTFATTVRRGLADSILLFHLASSARSRSWQRMRSPGGGDAMAHGVIQAASARPPRADDPAPGLTIALAAGSKLNGALTAPVYALVLFLAAIRIRDGATPLRRRLMTVLVVIGLTALVASSCSSA